MDPNETLTAIGVAIAAGDIAYSLALAGALEGWIAKGGFEPEWFRHEPDASQFCHLARKDRRKARAYARKVARFEAGETVAW